MKKTKSKKTKSSNIWKCMSCQGNPEFEHAAAMEHVQKVHGIDPTKIRGKKTMVMHCDGADFYSSTFEWLMDCEVGQLRMMQYTTSERDKENKAYWS